MKTALFSDDDIPLSLSPKLKWLEKHGIMTHHEPEMDGLDEDEFGNEFYPWVCGAGINGPAAVTGCGNTEEEAIINYCEKTGTLHYTLA